MEITLDKLDLNSTAKVISINCADNIKTRLLDLGIVEGTTITPLFKSIYNDPIAYNVRGSTLAIRSDDSKHIIVFHDI